MDDKTPATTAANDPQDRLLGTSLNDLHMRVSFAYRLMRNYTTPSSRALGLGPGQPRILSYVAAHGPCTQREIAAHYYIDASAVSRMLDNLERGGFLQCEPGRDRRSKEVSLTDLGRETIEAWDRTCEAVDDAMVSDFTDEEVDQLCMLLDRVHRNLVDAIAARDERRREDFTSMVGDGGSHA
ncbi:MarR family winged helix-turn-helix transcriptional regulator [Collinsella tanakaei]|uniref:MarR family winged helix-turn-helix transcriptional regulator n=1 Tax=Collinsella tanakaei TaxID=626935 RepID=UPI00195E3835|nr:MarR family transcriptional regulator [Collinsella tanakaei]